MRISLPYRSLVGQVALVFCLTLFVSSCVTDRDFLYLNDQLVALNKRVDGLQSKDLGSVREQQAKSDAELYKIRQEMQGVSGRLDENNRLVMRVVEKDTMKLDEMDRSIAALNNRISRLEAGVNRLHAYLNLEPTVSVPAQEETEGKPMEGHEVKPGSQGPAIKPPAPAAPVIEKVEVFTEQEMYDVNMTLFREEKYEEAIAGFKNFVEKYPKSDLADNAQFWVGESYMALKQYEQAILAFQSVIKKYPKGNKVPNATLRQAVAFYEINDKTSSKLLLKKLIKEFPKSTEAKIADTKLKAMK